MLHGLCTNDIKGLTPGDGCEAFLTNVQGKTAGYAYVFCRVETLLLDTVAGLAAEIIPALDRYIIREDAKLSDRSQELHEVLLSGDKAPGLLQSLGITTPPNVEYAHAEAFVADMPVDIRRVSYCSPTCFFLSCRSEQAVQLLAVLRDAGAIPCAPEVVDALRIEMGTPVFGLDLSADNLPQEVGRDRQAISFTKGCYLGQETVARLDALGHVNRQLVGLRFSGEQIPPPGTILEIEGKAVARVTSSCWSPRLNAPLALAYVRRGHEVIGTTLRSDPWQAEVVRLPLQR